MKKLLFLLLCGNSLLLAQTTDIGHEADSLYKIGSFAQAGSLYQKSAETGWMKAMRRNDHYHAACSFALANQTDKAFENLNLMIGNGYTNKAQLETNCDLARLQCDVRWEKTLASIKKNAGENPHNAKFITSDIVNFYHAFDLAMKDPAKAKQIFRKEYFCKGSDGLQDFFVGQIRDEDLFVRTIFEYRDFYASARQTILQTTAIKGPICKNAATFEDLYPQAVFPDVYFVVGRFNSSGTISDNGLLIGTEQMSQTPETDTSAWKDWQNERIMNFSDIPVTVSNELVHFNQDGMKRENTLLCYAIMEGSAEFITELVTGKTEGNYAAFTGREQQIWQDFKNDMDADMYSEWIMEQPDKRPKNGMDWMGYMICKAYYEKASDKKQAIYDMLNIQDYKFFLKKSEVGLYITELQ